MCPRQAVGDNLLGPAVALYRFLEEFQRCSFVYAFRDGCFQDLALMIYDTPEVVSLAIHFHKNLVDVPAPFQECAQFPLPLSSDLSSEHRSEPVLTIADGFMAGICSAFMHKIRGVPKRKSETDV